METPTLTKEQVMRAERREGVYHPVINVLDAYTPQFAELIKQYSLLTDNQEQQRFIHANFASLADDIEAIGEDYTLLPLELIAIWSKALEIGFDGYHRKVGLGMILPNAYAIRGIQNPSWRGLSRVMLGRYELPESVQQDKEGLLYVRRRVEQVRASLDEVEFYKNGNRDGMEKVVDLAMKSRDGDKKAEEELNRLIAYEKEHAIPVIHALLENLGSSVSLTLMKLNDFLER